ADVDHAPEPEVLLQRLRAAAYPAGLKVTASLGLCTGMLHDEEDWRKLYREADQALFAAKNAGRDRACWAPELHGPVPSQPVVTPLSAPL
ncbi:diguanylate cyclase, partial [Pseudomonas frederiksbergensis]|nr:diguanylate cyclase [Pseudomonas frederiksbergensis]